MNITFETSEHIINAIIYTLHTLHPSLTTEQLENAASDLYLGYCDAMDIEFVQDPNDLSEVVEIFFTGRL